MRKKFIGVVVGILIFTSSPISYVYADNNYIQESESLELKMVVDKKEAVLGGLPYTLPTSPRILQGRTYLPLRFVIENILQAYVEFDHDTKSISIHKLGTRVEMTVGKNTAVVNGNKVIIDGTPVIIDGSTLVPVRFLSESFGLNVDYDHLSKTIKITQKDIKPNKLPVAHFTLNKDSYKEGEEISVIETSYDEDEDIIINKVWEIKGKGTSKDVEILLKDLKPGEHILSLTVQDERGAWSETYEQTITILPNMAPVITEFNGTKESYSKGEKIEFDYKYENEEDEKIKSERWLYYKEGESINQAVISKPVAFFTEGTYNVSLQITDEKGKTSEPVTTQIKITDNTHMSEWKYHFTEGKLGSTIDNFGGVNYRDYENAKIENIKLNDNILWVSDSPEIVYTDGILYEGKFNGEGRILLHHINGYHELEAPNKKFVLVAQNITSEPISVRVGHMTIKGPNPDILYLGQHVLFDYWKSSSSNEVILAPGEKMTIYTSQSKNWLKDYGISGMMDIETSGEIKLTTASMDKNKDIEHIVNLPYLDKGIHIRGTFEGTVKYYDVEIEDKQPTKIIIGETNDEWVKGIDAVTGEASQNKGNFGVTYRFTLTAKEDTGIFLNPRADVFRGAIKWVDTGTYLAPKDGFFTGQNRKAILLGVIKKGETRILEYMLPNGSSAPVLLGFVPKSDW